MAMSEMDNEKLKKISNLDPVYQTILYWRCRKTYTNKEIYFFLDITEGDFYTYQKLSFAILNVGDFDEFQKEYCKTLLEAVGELEKFQEVNLPPPKVPQDEPQDTPAKEETTSEDTKEGDSKTGSNLSRNLIIGAFVVLMVFAFGYYLGLQTADDSSPPPGVTSPPQAVSPEVIIQTQVFTVEVMVTPELVLETEVPVAPPVQITQPTPEATSQPASPIVTPEPVTTATQVSSGPIILGPYEFNVDDGVPQEFIVLEGSLFVATGDYLSALQDSWFVVGDPDWKNYIVELRIVDFPPGPVICAVGDDANAIAVRFQNQGNTMMLRYLHCEMDWIEAKSGERPLRITGTRFSSGEVGVLEQRNIRVEVNGDIYTTYIDDLEINSFNYKSFESGQIAFRIKKDALVDDIKITVLP